MENICQHDSLGGNNKKSLCKISSLDRLSCNHKKTSCFYFLFLFLVCYNSEKTGTFMPFTCSSVGLCSITEFEGGLYLWNAVKLTTIQSKVQNFLSSLFQSPPVGWIGVFAGILLTLKPYVWHSWHTPFLHPWTHLDYWLLITQVLSLFN